MELQVNAQCIVGIHFLVHESGWEQLSSSGYGGVLVYGWWDQICGEENKWKKWSSEIFTISAHVPAATSRVRACDMCVRYSPFDIMIFRMELSVWPIS